MNGSAAVLSPRSAASISDSAVELLTAPCFLLNAHHGIYGWTVDGAQYARCAL